MNLWRGQQVMTLDHHQKYRQVCSFILRLDSNAVTRGEIAGRLENMVSGERFEFSGGDQLLACLAEYSGRVLQKSTAEVITGYPENAAD